MLICTHAIHKYWKMFSSFTATVLPALIYHTNSTHSLPTTTTQSHQTSLLQHCFRSDSPGCYVRALFNGKLPRHSWIRNQRRHAHNNQWKTRYSHLATTSPPPKYFPYDSSKQSRQAKENIVANIISTFTLQTITKQFMCAWQQLKKVHYDKNSIQLFLRAASATNWPITGTALNSYKITYNTD